MAASEEYKAHVDALLAPVKGEMAALKAAEAAPVCPKCGTSGCLEDKALDF
jgi:hypothetical protein